MPKISERLQQGRDLISKKENWTTGAYVRDTLYNSVSTRSERAFCFCSHGAICKVVPLEESTGDVAHYLRLVMGDIISFNDSHDHTEVLKAWDLAIELAKKDEEHAG